MKVMFFIFREVTSFFVWTYEKFFVGGLMAFQGGSS